jgi:hypothetical protein
VKDGQAYEGLQRLDLSRGVLRDRDLLAKEKADYLKENSGGVAIAAQTVKFLDSSVGFSNAPPAGIPLRV